MHLGKFRLRLIKRVVLFTDRFGFFYTQSYEGKSIDNQPIPFPIDRDTQDFHALFQYMF